MNSASLPFVPPEVIGMIARYLSEEDLTFLSRSFRLGRQWVHSIAGTRVGDILFPFLRSLGYSEVTGNVTVRDMAEAMMVHEQIQGPLHLVIKNLDRESLASVLRIVEARSALYPSSSFTVESSGTTIWSTGSTTFGAHVAFRIRNTGEDTFQMVFDMVLARVVRDREELSLRLEDTEPLQEVVPETVRAIRDNAALKCIGLPDHGDNTSFLEILRGGPPRNLTTIFSYHPPGLAHSAAPWTTISTLMERNNQVSVTHSGEFVQAIAYNDHLLSMETLEGHEGHDDEGCNLRYREVSESIARVSERLEEGRVFKEQLANIQELRGVYIPIFKLGDAIPLFPRVPSFDILLYHDTDSYSKLEQVTDVNTLNLFHRVGWRVAESLAKSHGVHLRFFRAM